MRVRFGALCALVLCVCAGCAVDRLHARRALATSTAAQETTIDCAAPDACAHASPFHALTEHALAESRPGAPVHYVELLDRGEDALLLRIHLVRAARRSIDVQTYIFEEDDAGFLMLDELVKAARRGVKVRVIVDQLFSLDDIELLAQLARAHVNFELRVYNPTFHKASTEPLEFAMGILCCFTEFNQRMHNKLLLIDGEIGIAGGRNYQNRYFDWDDEFDYRDRDVLVAGPAGAAMQASFDAFWRNENSVALSRLRDVSRRILDDGLDGAAYASHTYKNAARVDSLSRRADDVDYIDANFAQQAMRVGDVEYFSDAPNKRGDARPQSAPLSGHILDLLRGAQHEIVLQTPYLVLSKTAQDVFRQQHKQRPDLRILVSTNSLAATDAFVVYALSYKYKKRYLKFGFEIHELKPFPAEASELIANYPTLGRVETPAPSGKIGRYSKPPLHHGGVRVSLHAKTILIDGDIALIGSHNFDPRSDHYNSEAGFIIRDRAFTTLVRDAIVRDAEPDNAWTIARRERRGWISRLNARIGDLSAALPVFDLWPFRYASSFEIKPGCAPMRPQNPDFYTCYDDVGDFPEVDLPLKTIYTRIVTAFGAGLQSIL
ncbi:MAG TPA: phosphatidylserine/phosphatidylglycerophosphate/cardiolipin synthase family protein [Rudaea sp.]|jgi:phosphatidylserine/phosphatidylglycerophosphate/cardiolipin synthase-like enzyme|nr:phosphatidylserine/phosphatidylglycerophosphate/cardiolipin synthase family protein [Rudaea sp.]